VPYEGSSRPATPVSVEGGIDDVVIFCGKFADWKRLDVLLRAAAVYEATMEKEDGRSVATLIVGSGPLEDQKRMQDFAFEELGLRHVFFLGPRQQDDLAVLYNVADVGCFPSYNEPFGLVFVECMACGTPVVGADSGGPRDIVRPEFGALVPESGDKDELARSLAVTLTSALRDGWKQSKGEAAARDAASRFSVRQQCAGLLAGVDRLMSGVAPSAAVR
jgi:glycosyltransferase involved in cell wall biosynthesis